MALPAAQNPLDWTTQLWNIALGQRVNRKTDGWLLGPIGDIGGIADHYIERVATEQALTVRRNLPNSGLVHEFAAPR